MNKNCNKCHITKLKSEFVKNSRSKDGLYSWCKSCQKEARQSWEKKNIEKNPWYNSYNNAKQRCENKNNPNYFWYGAKGIKFLLTKEECRFLWNRDEAWKLKFPTIDRINNKENYTVDNCRFIENLDNLKKDNIGHFHNNTYIKYVPIEQYDTNMNLLKTWESQGQISKELNFDQGSISKAIKHGYKRYGFYWKKQKVTA